MNKHLIVLGIAVLLLAVGLSGCFDGQISEENKFALHLKVWHPCEGTRFSIYVNNNVVCYKHSLWYEVGHMKYYNVHKEISSDDGINDIKVIHHRETFYLDDEIKTKTVYGEWVDIDITWSGIKIETD